MAIIIIISFIISLLSGMGVGGGGLFAVFLAIFTDTPQLAVQGFNLLFFLFSAASSVSVRALRGGLPFDAILLMAGAGLLGSLAGSYLAVILPEQLLRQAFGVMLVSTGLFSLRASASQKYSQKKLTQSAPRGADTTDGDTKKDEK